MGHFKSLSPVFLPSQGLFSKLLPFPQSEKLLVFLVFFSVGLRCLQQKERRFILRLMDHYNIGSVASSCGCDLSL